MANSTRAQAFSTQIIAPKKLTMITAVTSLPPAEPRTLPTASGRDAPDAPHCEAGIACM